MIAHTDPVQPENAFAAWFEFQLAEGKWRFSGKMTLICFLCFCFFLERVYGWSHQGGASVMPRAQGGKVQGWFTPTKLALVGTCM